MTQWYVHHSSYSLCSMKAQFAEQLPLALGLSHRTTVYPTKTRNRTSILLIQPVEIVSIVMTVEMLTQEIADTRKCAAGFFQKESVEPRKSAFTLSSSSSDDTLAMRKQLGTHDKMPFKASAPSGFKTNPASFFSSISPFKNIVALDTVDIVDVLRCPVICATKSRFSPTESKYVYIYILFHFILLRKERAADERKER